MHVLVKFLSLVLLALALSNAKPTQFIGLVSVVNSLAMLMYAYEFTRMLTRVKWLLIILVALYAFSTPGEYITVLNIPIRPSYEGVFAGLTQMLVISTMLASLTLVLSSTPRAMLIGGLYQLIAPFKCLGMQAEQFAVRIWLTLHYVESEQTPMQLRTLNLNDALNHHLSNSPVMNKPITMDIEPFKLNDYLMVALALFGVLFWVL